MKINIDYINFDNKYFWLYFLATSFPNGYNEEIDMSAGEIFEVIFNLDNDETSKWVDNFTGYYEGVIEENDGYIDNPSTVILKLNKDANLKIEFHPGDTIYYINENIIGCTGPHWELYAIKWNEIVKFSEGSLYPDYAFWLLLPMAAVTSENNIEEVKRVIIERLKIFKYISHERDCDLVNAIISGIYNG